jgi:hypothetical protein
MAGPETGGWPPANTSELPPTERYLQAPLTHEEDYLRALRAAGADLSRIDFSDPDLQARLDLPLGNVTQYGDDREPSELQRIRTALDGVPITVRDALTLGLANVRDIRDIGAKRVERLKEGLLACVPEFPVMEDYAPASVSRRLYHDANDVPVASPLGGARLTVGNCIDNTIPISRRYYLERVRSVLNAYSEPEGDLPEVGNEGGTDGTSDAEEHYTEYVSSTSYRDRYMGAFDAYVSPDLDINDENVQARLDMPLADILATSQNDRVWRASQRTNLTVRDVIALGAYEGLFTLPGITEADDATICGLVQAHIPELPLLAGVAPKEVAQLLYDDPYQVPLSSVGGEKITVRDIVGREEAGRFRGRITALLGTQAAALPERQAATSMAETEGVAADGDAVVRAIDRILRTFE